MPNAGSCTGGSEVVWLSLCSSATLMASLTQNTNCIITIVLSSAHQGKTLRSPQYLPVGPTCRGVTSPLQLRTAPAAAMRHSGWGPGALASGKMPGTASVHYRVV